MIHDTFDGCTITYLTRSDWGAGPHRAGHPVPMSSFVGWYLHHTVFVMGDYDRDGILHGDLDDICRYMAILQGARPDLGGEVPYSVLPFQGTNDRSCVVVEGRGPGWSGAHTAGQNSDHYAWSLPTDSRVEPPTEGQIAGMRWVANRWTPNATDRARGHRQAPPYWDNGVNLNATACPGDPGIAVLDRLQPPYLIPPEDDMYSDEDRKRDNEAAVNAKAARVAAEKAAKDAAKALKIVRDQISGEDSPSIKGQVNAIWERTKP